MTGLLVSVRDASEARAALCGGADLIDIKEPRRGSLGPADVNTWRDIARCIAGAKPLSVALGELQDDPTVDLARQTDGMRFAKIGLSRCKQNVDWQKRWQAAIVSLPQGVASAAVIYADHAVARAPAPQVVLQHAIEFGCKAILIDTYFKAQGHLFDHLSEPELRGLCADAAQAEMQVVLAGSLRGDLVLRGLALSPDYIAVRGAVCRGDRSTTVDQSLIESLAELVHHHASASC